MGFVTANGGVASASVGSSGLVEYVAGVSTLDAAALDAENQDLQAPGMYALLPGVLSGGVCTAAALVVTIPSGTSYFARTVWSTTSAATKSVPDTATSSIWGCADGQLRLGATSTTAPAGWTSGSNCCLITTATAAAGTATVDNTTQHKARRTSARTVIDGPLTLSYSAGTAVFSGSVSAVSLALSGALAVGGNLGFFGAPAVTKTAVADPVALTSAHAAGDPPTGAEFNLAVDDITALRTKLAALLDVLQSYGLV